MSSNTDFISHLMNKITQTCVSVINLELIACNSQSLLLHWLNFTNEIDFIFWACVACGIYMVVIFNICYSSEVVTQVEKLTNKLTQTNLLTIITTFKAPLYELKLKHYWNNQGAKLIPKQE